MATAVNSSPVPHSPPSHDVKRPKGILKNSFQRSPRSNAPAANAPSNPSPTHVAHAANSLDSDTAVDGETPLSEKEITIHNTQYNAGHRRSSSAVRPGAASRRQSSRTPSHHGTGGDEESSQRLKWDEANIYLTEQERTATMKINEPKTPYVKHYNADDEEDDEDVDMDGEGGGPASGGPNDVDEIPGLSLGEPEEEVPEGEFEKRPRAVHVDSAGSGHDNDEDELVGLSAEEREKHRRFEAMRKKHYEMKGVAHLLGHPEDIDDLADNGEGDNDDEEADGAAVPPVPPVPNMNGRAA